jgi:CheY-like chemotaxis protein
VERPHAQHRRAERRRLFDRRSPFPRRQGDERRRSDRRNAAKQAASERRNGKDRRGADRRELENRRAGQSRRRGRRRMESPIPFTAEQVSEVRAQFAVPGPVNCPACGGAFTLGPSRRRGDQSARRVVCLGCGSAAVVPKSWQARILLISEHGVVRNALQAALASVGHEVIEAADAGVGLLAYERVPADVVFLDMLAPGRMEAPEFLRRLRRLFPEARVVAMAQRPIYAGVDLLAVAQGLGAVRALRMPISRDQLLKTVEDVRP